jgi:CMP-N-acetylneuraminic acid synthetase
VTATAPDPGPRILGLIPAKGGSVRLPRKNILPLAGKPLLHWAAEAARGSGVIDRLIVSTDDDEIAEVARAAGVEVPFRRPADLGREPAGVEQVALHALDTLSADGEAYEVLVILLPTSPLRQAGDIRAAIERFFALGATNLMSVTAVEHPPFNTLTLRSDEMLEPLFPDLAARRPGDLPRAYRPNGAISVLDVPTFLRSGSYLAPPIHAFVMPRDRSVDIDNEEDLAFAEFLLARTAPAVSPGAGR